MDSSSFVPPFHVSGGEIRDARGRYVTLWGVNYYADGFQEKSGLYAQDVEVPELYRVAAYFTEELNAASQAVPRKGLPP